MRAARGGRLDGLAYSHTQTVHCTGVARFLLEMASVALSGLLSFLHIAGPAAEDSERECPAAVVTIEDVYTVPAWGILMKLLRDAVRSGAAAMHRPDGGAPTFQRIVVICANHCREDCVASLERANIPLPEEGRSGRSDEMALHFIDIGSRVFGGVGDGEWLSAESIAAYSTRADVSASGAKNAYAEQLMGSLRAVTDDCNGVRTLYLVDSANAISLGVNSHAHFLEFLDQLTGRQCARDDGVVIVAHKDVHRDVGLIRYIEDVSDIIIDVSPLSSGPAEQADGTLGVTCRTTRVGSILRRDEMVQSTLAEKMLFKQREAGALDVFRL